MVGHSVHGRAIRFARVSWMWHGVRVRSRGRDVRIVDVEWVRVRVRGLVACRAMDGGDGARVGRRRVVVVELVVELVERVDDVDERVSVAFVRSVEVEVEIEIETSIDIEERSRARNDRSRGRCDGCPRARRP